MRTTLNIDDKWLKQAARLTGIEEKTSLVRLGLEALFIPARSSLVDEIKSQKEIADAENNELKANRIRLESAALIDEVIDVYRMHPVAEGRLLQKDKASEKTGFTSDKALLSRVLGNMTKNALEACQDGDTVTIGCRKEGEKVLFWVHNPAFMPRNIQLQVFQRSFSTKGAGRGLGTYSIKMLSERYLKGSVSFTSSEESGTTFWASYPVALEDELPDSPMELALDNSSPYS